MRTLTLIMPVFIVISTSNALELEYLGDIGETVSDLKVGPDGILYIATRQHVYQRSNEGVFTRIAGSGALSSFSTEGNALEVNITPQTLAFSPQGELYIASQGTYEGLNIFKLTQDGMLERIAGNGDHYATSNGSGHGIENHVPPPEGMDVRDAALPVFSSFGPYGSMTVDEEGSIYLNGYSSIIYRISPDGKIHYYYEPFEHRTTDSPSFSLLHRFADGRIWAFLQQSLFVSIDRDGNAQKHEINPMLYEVESIDDLGMVGYGRDDGDNRLFFLFPGQSEPIHLLTLPDDVENDLRRSRTEGIYLTYDSQHDLLYFCGVANASISGDGLSKLYRISGIRAAVTTNVADWLAY